MVMVKRPRLVCILAVAILGVLWSPVFGGYSRGGSFTAPGYGARAWGMGGAAVAIGADEGAAYWNPALLSLLAGGRLGLSYVEPVPGADVRHSFLAYASPLKRGNPDEPNLAFNSHAIGIVYSNLNLEIPDGRAYSENALLIGYSYSREYLVSFGVSMGVLFSSGDVGNFDARGTTVHAGMRAAVFERLTLGFVVRNAFSYVMFDSGEDYSLDRSLALGLGMRILENATIEGDVVAAFGGIARLVLGGEATLFSDVLALRGGLSAVTAGESRVLPHMGVGVGFRRFRLDYNANFDDEEALGNTHRFSLAVGI
jgi:hypothetical protein